MEGYLVVVVGLKLGWLIHGLFMGYSWVIHGLFMGYSMGYSWVIHGLFMGYSWVIHGLFMGYSWVIMVRFWMVCGFCVDSVWYFFVTSWFSAIFGFQLLKPHQRPAGCVAWGQGSRWTIPLRPSRICHIQAMVKPLPGFLVMVNDGWWW